MYLISGSLCTLYLTSSSVSGRGAPSVSGRKTAMTPPTRHESPMMKSGTATGLMPMMKGASIPPIL